jgi:hypothetical protein
MRNAFENFSRGFLRDFLEDPGIDGRIILILMVTKSGKRK